VLSLALLRKETLCFIHAIPYSYGSWVSILVVDYSTSATAIHHEYVVSAIVLIIV